MFFFSFILPPVFAEVDEDFEINGLSPESKES